MRHERIRSIGAILQEYKNIGPGFDFLRIFLALSIVIFHSLSVTNQYFVPYSLDDTAFWIVHYSLVPMFFALSGFLISGSAGRLSLKNFLINRGIRIVPALAVDTFVCALIIGPIFTTVRLRDYFFNSEFGVFFLNIIGWVHFTLPGVFMTHPIARVNGSLWTVPFELACYALISGMIVTGVIRSRLIVLACVILYLSASCLVQAADLLSFVHLHLLAQVLSVVFLEHEAQAVTAFLVGIVMFQNRFIIPYSFGLFTICVLVIAIVAFSMNFDQGQTPVMRFLLIPALVYSTIFVGLTPMPLPGFFKTGDYSYGIYLYHMPFLQIFLALFPAYAMIRPTGFLMTLIAALPFIIGVAWLSWHLVEKPLLGLRKKYSLAAKMRGGEASAPVGNRHDAQLGNISSP